MMKFSFQTFCLVFLVTVVHLILITVFAPLSDTAGEYFAGLEVEEMLEQGRADLAALVKEDLDGSSPDERSHGETAGPPSSAVLRPEEESLRSDESPKDAEAVALLGRREGAAAVVSEEAMAEPAAIVLTDPRLLAKRISRPEPAASAIAKPVRSDSEKGTGTNPKTTKVAEAKTSEASIAQGASSKLRTETTRGAIREIRPIPRL